MKRIKLFVISLIAATFALTACGGGGGGNGGSGGGDSAPSWKVVGNAKFTENQADNIRIAIDSKGTPYLAYSDNSNGSKPVVIKFNGTAWEMLGGGPVSEKGVNQIALAIDGNDVPYVTYSERLSGTFQYEHNKIVIKKFVDNDWEELYNKEVDKWVPFISIAINSSNDPYVVYSKIFNNPEEDVKNATLLIPDNGAWTEVEVSEGGVIYSSIAIDSNDIPYVAFGDFKEENEIEDFKATVKKYVSSNLVEVGQSRFSDNTASNISIAIDKNNIPYVAYVDYDDDEGTVDKVTVMKHNGSDWVPVGDKGFSPGEAMYLSIAIDSNNVPYVAFMDLANGSKATVMKFDGGKWVALGGFGFSSERADYISFTFDINNVPYVAFQGGSTVMVYR